MAKRLICVIISVLMIVSLLPTGAFATDVDEALASASSEEPTVTDSAETDENVEESEVEETETVEETVTLGVSLASTNVVSLTNNGTTAGYASVIAAVAAAPTDGTAVAIQLLDDTTETDEIYVQSGMNITLDLNGHTLTTGVGSDGVDNVFIKGTLTVIDSTGDGGTISLSGSSYGYGVYVGTGGILNLASGSIVNNNSWENAIFAVGTVNITGGTVSSAHFGIQAYAGATVNISGGSVSGNACGVSGNNTSSYYSSNGATTVTITGGTISGSSAVQAAYGSEITVENGTINGTEKGIEVEDDTTVVVAVSGGTITGDTTAIISGVESASVTVSGGTFSDSVEEYLAEGVSETSNTDGTYTVGDSKTYIALNSNKNTKYETLAEAITAASSDETIQLLQNDELSNQITISSTVKLDLNGKTVEYQNADYDSVFYINANASLTITDSSTDNSGTITASSGNATIYVSGGTLTVSGGTITNSYSSGVGIKALSSATVNVNGGTISGINQGLSASSSTVTVSGDSTVIESTGGDSSAYGVNLQEGSTLTVGGGTIKGRIAGVYMQDNSTVTVNGGTLSGTGTGAENGSGLRSYSGTVNVNGGEISGNYGIYTTGEGTMKLFVSGGSISGTTYGIYLKSTSEVTLSGGSITSSGYGVYAESSSGSMTVPKGSTVTVKGSDSALKVKSGVSFVFSISGGHYSSAVEETYCADGYKPYIETSGEYCEAGLQYTVKSTSFTLGISSDSTKTVEAEIFSGEGTSELYVKVSGSSISDNYAVDAYPTTTLTYSVDEGSVDSGNYIFAGWYSYDEESNSYSPCSSSMWDDSLSGDYYAKFVDANVLTVMTQLTADTTAQSSSTNMRFVSTVDSLDYSKVGFKFTIIGKESDKSTTTVYKSIVASAEDDSFSYSPSYISTSSEYFFTFTITGIPQSAFSTDITVIPYWITADGTTVYGTTKTVTVSMGLTASE